MKSGARILRPALLTALNLGLLGVAAFLWMRGQERIGEPARIVAAPLGLPAMSTLEPSATRSVAADSIRDAAIFYSRRTYFQPAPPSTLLPPPDYQLAGILNLPRDKRVAFLKKGADHTSRSVHAGDDLEGWHVESIDTASVNLIHETQRVQLRAAAGTTNPGLIRGNTAPRVAQSGPRTLSATGAVSAAPAATGLIAEARLYRPPPH